MIREKMNKYHFRLIVSNRSIQFISVKSAFWGNFSFPKRAISREVVINVPGIEEYSRNANIKIPTRLYHFVPVVTGYIL